VFHRVIRVPGADRESPGFESTLFQAPARELS